MITVKNFKSVLQAMNFVQNNNIYDAPSIFMNNFL